MTKLQAQASGHIGCHSAISLEAEEVPSLHHNGAGQGQIQLFKIKQKNRWVPLPPTPAGPGPRCAIY